MRGSAAGTFVWLAMATSACGPPPLANTHDSAEALVRGALTALERRDEARLRSLALTEDEFRQHVWRALPAARPERNLPFSYLWSELRQKSEARLRGRLDVHGGRSYELQRFVFTGGATPYPGFTVHRDTLLVVRDSTGGEQQIRLFGSAIESHGAWKVFSFNADD